MEVEKFGLIFPTDFAFGLSGEGQLLVPVLLSTQLCSAFGLQTKIHV